MVLTDSVIQKIKELKATQQLTHVKLGEMFGVTASGISRALQRASGVVRVRKPRRKLIESVSVSVSVPFEANSPTSSKQDRLEKLRQRHWELMRQREEEEAS